MDFHGTAVRNLELVPAIAIEIANALIGNAFMIINARTPESTNLDTERKADERPN
jgi:hypothetical protein